MNKAAGKYHIDDAGEVFQVNDDGSVTDLGNVSLLRNKQVFSGERMRYSSPSSTRYNQAESFSRRASLSSSPSDAEKHKSPLTVFIVIVSILITMCSLAYAYKMEQDLESAVDETFTVWGEVKGKGELISSMSDSITLLRDSINLMIFPHNPLRVTEVEFAQVDTLGNGKYGKTQFDYSVYLIQPRIKYVGEISGNSNLSIFIYKPSGALFQSYDYDIYCRKGVSDEEILPKIDWTDESSFGKSGTWVYELWSGSDILASKRFIIEEAPWYWEF